VIDGPTTTMPIGPAAGGTHGYGPYQLLERVAVGGMAEVFRAKRTGVEGFEKVVAVKRILSHLSDNKEFVDMFIDEAKMVAGLAHPNVVQIFDLGKHEKNYWIAMEYVHGRDLRTIIRRARERGMKIPLDISTYVVSKVCAALEYAHRKKDDKGQPMLIVHRDISPQNILISFEGDVKLTDFGIAKAASKASTTDKGALRGKLLYMSPEQAWGKPMDKRSDVFSLGIVFYEMLTEQKPFLGTSETSILETVRECRVPPPTTINDKIPEKLEKVVMKALERDPEVRYQDAGDMLRDLERVLHEWQPATATGLVRFLELLFDEHERGDIVAPEGDAHARAGSGIDELQEHVPEPPPAEPPPAPPTKDPMSIQKLLKRFGIK
jgi:serine/threonine protein kinase